MGFEIVAPRAPIADKNGFISQEWYRFLVQVQRVTGEGLIESLRDAEYLTYTPAAALTNAKSLLAGTALSLVSTASDVTINLDDTAVTAGAYGSANQIPAFTVDQQGRIILASSAALNSDNVTEGATNLFYTDARARGAISAGTGLSYDSGTGVVSPGAVLAAYAGGDTPSAFTLGIVDSVDGAAWRTAIGAGTSSTTGTVTSVSGSGGTTGLTLSGGPITSSGTLTLGGTLAVAHGGTGVTTSTGSGNNVLSTSPTLVTPILGTPTSGALTNCTGLPISTGVSGLGASVATFLATPSSANLAAAVTDETGSGALVFGTSPTIATPSLTSPTISGTAGNLHSGTYTPTLTNVTNLAASTAYECQYMRVGNVVTVSGRVDVDPTAAAATELGISLPIASNIANSFNCNGTGAAETVSGFSAAIYGDTTNDRARLMWLATDTANRAMAFHFTYIVK